MVGLDSQLYQLKQLIIKELCIKPQHAAMCWDTNVLPWCRSKCPEKELWLEINTAQSCWYKPMQPWTFEGRDEHILWNWIISCHNPAQTSTQTIFSNWKNASWFLWDGLFVSRVPVCLNELWCVCVCPVMESTHMSLIMKKMTSAVTVTVLR